MQLATLDVSKDQARAAVKEYRQAVARHNKAEDRAILRGYNQVIRGRKLIQLSKVIAAGGADEQGRPRLAVMRADERLCYVVFGSDGSLGFRASEFHRSIRTEFPGGTMPSGKWGRAQSIVPLIPPRHRPADALSNYHILWEADWKEVPSDPALLKHLGGDLWAVCAVWDLTALEIAVLGGRR